jgi:hypothetical protein
MWTFCPLLTFHLLQAIYLNTSMQFKLLISFNDAELESKIVSGRIKMKCITEESTLLSIAATLCVLINPIPSQLFFFFVTSFFAPLVYMAEE